MRAATPLFVAILWLSTLASFGQAPIFTNAMIVGGDFQVDTDRFNATFTIQTSTNLTSWTSVDSQTATNSLISLVDPRGIAGFNRQYYRLVLGGGNGGGLINYNFGFRPDLPMRGIGCRFHAGHGFFGDAQFLLRHFRSAERHQLSGGHQCLISQARPCPA